MSSDGGSGSPLDGGAFLLQLLRNPPQSQPQPRPQPLNQFFHNVPSPSHETLATLNPPPPQLLDPAVAAVGSTTYPSSHHSLLRINSNQEVLHHRFSPPGFSLHQQRAPPPGFPSHPKQFSAGSPPVFRGDFLGNSGGRSNQHQRSGSNGNVNSYSKTNLNLDMFMHKAGSSNADHVFAEQKRDLKRNVHHNGQSSLQNDTMHRVGLQQNRKHDEYVRKNGFFEELDRNRNDGREKDKFFENSCNEDLPKKSDGDYDCLDDLPENLDLLLVSEETSEGSATKNANHLRSKDVRIDLFRGHNVSGQRARIRRRELRCRCDIDNFTPLFLSIYASLIPADEEKRKQKQLLHNLGKLVNQEWPTAQLHLYGSCANSFGVSNSDIDLCLAIDNVDMSKSEILLKLAEILEQGNLQNVQALTHARVPIVKMMDPITGISCDVCINNLLAVANTKLLRDYAQIDVRLRMLLLLLWMKLKRLFSPFMMPRVRGQIDFQKNSTNFTGMTCQISWGATDFRLYPCLPLFFPITKDRCKIRRMGQ